MTVDKLELIVPLTDIRDALHTDGFLDPDLPGGPGIRIRKPTVTAFIRTNPAAMHNGHDADPVLLQAHTEALQRMRFDS